MWKDTLGGAAIVALTITTFGAGTANAAPQDVLVSASTTAGGDTVAISFSNNSPTDFGAVLCEYAIYEDPHVPIEDDPVDGIVEAFQLVPADQPTAPVNYALPDGNYHLYWICSGPLNTGNPNPLAAWGTAPLPSMIQGVTYPPTHDSQAIVIPGPEPESNCFGSVCLP